ncbi:MAG: cation transporter [Ignavibacteria bacterium]|jgi:copper chaperone CopZ|nr:cation transporter [Ignavibacteria bacterium]
MLKNILSVALVAILLSVPSLFAKDIQKLNLSGNIECNSCKNKIEKALTGANGVEKAKVDLKKQSIKVEYDKDVISQEQVITLVNNAESGVNAVVATKDATKKAKTADAKACCKKEGKSCCKEGGDKPCHGSEKK